MTSKGEFAAGRGLYYSLFSRFFVFSQDADRFAGVNAMLGLAAAHALNEESAAAIMRIQAKFDEKNPQNLVDEFDEIFHAPPSPLRNSLSYYDEGYEVGHACAKVRKILARTDLRRDEAKFKENEDNVGFLFALMSEFIARESELELYGELEEQLFKEVINPNVDEFIESLFNHESSEIYKDVAVLLQGFIEFERVVLSAPRPVNHGENKKTLDGVSRSEAIRRQKNRVRKLKAMEEENAKK
ncbi:TorD/DmsD family molecular chaperone [Campylobacter concisus]|uniref:TorD/DmsD family molecular chaperone n=1 Tax=Campylobacter concisus TaxID=199 RepID=UPI000CD8E258|nr:molecular chaperone TorD family protein [Campylobacter concisus]QPH87645.1 molecular chaperone TorD family protein [Campylobacter concisus]QPI02590.1 molecular chaperone TorD family protein [Campylobacter concisus]